MNWFSGVLVYVIVWWLVLFMVLPWGIRRAESPDPGHMPGAPERAMMWRKAAITSAIAGIVWLAVWFVIEYEIVSFRRMVTDGG